MALTVKELRKTCKSGKEDYISPDALHAYLTSDTRDFPEGSFICSMSRQMAELRLQAEECLRKKDTHAINARGALPCPDDVMGQVLDASEATLPQEVITMIAQLDYPLLADLVRHLRKILRRKRSMVPMSQVQQMDAHCLRWYARQPGRTPQEKGGTRQEMLAVIREESFDTQENRVVKDFFLRAERAATKYLREYKATYSSHERIKALNKLCLLAKEVRMMPEFAAVRAVQGIPRPNYVLLHDSRYHLVWARYGQLIYEARLAEMVWPHRHVLFEDYCRLMIHHHVGKGSRLFDGSLWMRPIPQAGSFFADPQWKNVTMLQGGGFMEVCTRGESIKLNWHSPIGVTKQVTIRVAYKPTIWQEQAIAPPSDGSTLLLYSPISENFKGDKVYCIQCTADISRAISSIITGLMA